MTEYYQVGTIVNTHGIKGEVRVQSITSHPEERYACGSELMWFNEQETQQELLTVKSHRVHKSFDLLTFMNHDNINDVEKFVRGTLNVTADQALELEDGEFYHYDIIGLSVYNESDELIGTIKEILETGANDVWVVQRSNKKDLLLPYIDAVIKMIDFDEKKVIVHVLEGLDD